MFTYRFYRLKNAKNLDEIERMARKQRQLRTDVARIHALTTPERGHDCRIVLPLYKGINPHFRASMTFITHMTVDVSWRKQYCGIFTAICNGVTYYFLDNEYYFGRDGIYGFLTTVSVLYFTVGRIWKCSGILTLKPDIINANDWQAAMIPVYYEVFYKYQQGYENIKNVFTIHNIQYQGNYGKEVLNEVMGLPMYHMSLLEYDGGVNMMKGAIETADKVTTVSPSYAWKFLIRGILTVWTEFCVQNSTSSAAF